MSKKKRRGRKKQAESTKPAVEAKPIKFGKLREAVKAGDYDPQAVLEWLPEGVPEGVNPPLVKWLRNRVQS